MFSTLNESRNGKFPILEQSVRLLSDAWSQRPSPEALLPIVPLRFPLKRGRSPKDGHLVTWLYSLRTGFGTASLEGRFPDLHYHTTKDTKELPRLMPFSVRTHARAILNELLHVEMTQRPDASLCRFLFLCSVLSSVSDVNESKFIKSKCIESSRSLGIIDRIKSSFEI